MSTVTCMYNSNRVGSMGCLYMCMYREYTKTDSKVRYVNMCFV